MTESRLTSRLPNVPQRVLDLDLPYLPTLDDVHTGANAAALHAADAWLGSARQSQALDANQRCVLTWGGQGTGKTILAHALSRAASATFLHPLSTTHDFSNAHTASCVVVDDIDAFDDARATAAFDIFNRLRNLPTGYWWATSSAPPARMTRLRADVSSRMGWGLVYELLPLNDDDSSAVLQSQAHRLGFDLNDETAQYLLLRLERNLSALEKHLASLNHYALSLKKPVNNHLVQQWYAHVYLPTLQTE